nr:sigma-70 family RNA polymerase sigma factor [Actinomycetota bacterium]
MSMTALSAETLFEHDLIDAARNGDDRAFEELYARYNGRITGFIHARVRDHGRSEDVAQEVFISALRRLRSTSQPIQFKPWIYEIAKNACIDEYRRTRRIREVSLDSGDDESDSSVLPSRAPTPLATVETKQRLTDLRGAFGGLSDSHHQLLVLREFEGLSYDEIGARTGMTRQMVESGLFRARRKLTEEYEELASGRRCSQIQSTIEAGRALSARSLGIRERRVFARHLAHCQPCRVAAHLAGVDETLVRRRRIGAKIAGLLPLPLWRWPWAAGRSRQLVFGAQPAVQT